MAVTNSQGNNTLSNLPAGSLIIRQVLQSGPAGTYTIRVVPPTPAGWKSTVSGGGSLVVKLQSGQVVTNYNFVFTRIAIPLVDLGLLG